MQNRKTSLLTKQQLKNIVIKLINELILECEVLKEGDKIYSKVMGMHILLEHFIILYTLQFGNDIYTEYKDYFALLDKETIRLNIHNVHESIN